VKDDNDDTNTATKRSQPSVYELTPFLKSARDAKTSETKINFLLFPMP